MEKVKSAGCNLEIIVKIVCIVIRLIVLGFAYMLKEVVAAHLGRFVCCLSFVRSENIHLNLGCHIKMTSVMLKRVKTTE